MVDIRATIDSGFSTAVMTFVASRNGVSLGTTAATVSQIASLVTLASATINMSGYGAGVVNLVLVVNSTGTIVWDSQLQIDAAGEPVAVMSELQAIRERTNLIGTQSEITVTTPVIPTKWRVFAFNRVTNEPVLGDAANITAKLAIDHAGPVALADVNPVEIEDGYYYFDLSAAEQTGAVFELFPESSTASVQVIGVPGRMESNATLRAIEAKTDLIGTGAALIGRLTWDTPGTLNFELLTSSTDQVLSITLLNEDGSPANLTGLVLTAVIESHDRSDIVTVPDGSIARSGNVITFSVPGAMLEIARTLRWSLRSGGGAILVGRIVVRYAATVDPTP